MAKKRILVTKELSDGQRKLLQKFDFVEKPLIKIELVHPINIEYPISIAVFSSKNGVKGFQKNIGDQPWNFEKIYCVGQKTSELISNYFDGEVLVANDARELSELIIENQEKEANFFCGNLRRNELPGALVKEGISVKEYLVYQTFFEGTKLKESFDSILSFSPSGVKSYIQADNSTKSTAFCIGNTTACEAIEHFDQVFVSEENSVEGLINTLQDFYHG